MLLGYLLRLYERHMTNTMLPSPLHWWLSSKWVVYQISRPGAVFLYWTRLCDGANIIGLVRTQTEYAPQYDHIEGYDCIFCRNFEL